MAAMNSPKILPSPGDILADRLATLYPAVRLSTGNAFLWSPKEKTVFYAPEKLKTDEGQWSLLHELSHADLNHTTYRNDFELLQLEVAAWERAATLAVELGTTINQNFIEDCLDSYRDWLHQRSTCPTCGSGGLQHDQKTYRCHNCHAVWTVSESRFCRIYRRKVQTGRKEKSSGTSDQTTFS